MARDSTNFKTALQGLKEVGKIKSLKLEEQARLFHCSNGVSHNSYKTLIFSYKFLFLEIYADLYDMSNMISILPIAFVIYVIWELKLKSNSDKLSAIGHGIMCSSSENGQSNSVQNALFYAVAIEPSG